MKQPGKQLDVLLDGLTFGEGPRWRDGKLWFSDFYSHRVMTVDLAGHAETIVEVPGCFPDGICLDAEGAVWVTNPQGDSVLRVFEGGRVAQKAHTGERRSFACMLGGADKRTLFVVTNTGSGPAIAEKKSGRIETIQVEVAGVGLP